MDCYLESLAVRTDTSKWSLSMHESLAAQLPTVEGRKENDYAVISAVCCSLNKREAVCEIMMHFPMSVPYILRLKYTVMAPKLFRKMFPPPLAFGQVEQVKAEERPSTSEPQPSPYAQFKGIPINMMKMLSRNSSNMVMRNSIKSISAESCQGHFDGNPALPIAFLTAICADLSGYAISAFINEPILFKMNHVGRKSSVGDTKKKNKYHLKFISVKVVANRLVQANTHGISLECKVTPEETGTYSSSVYSCVVSIRSLESEKKDDLVAKLSFKFELRLAAAKCDDILPAL